MSLLDAPVDYSHAKRKATDSLPEGLPSRLAKRARDNTYTDELSCGGSILAHGGSEHVQFLGAIASVATSELSSISLPPPTTARHPDRPSLSHQCTDDEFVLNSVDLDFDPESEEMDDEDGEMWASKMLFCISHSVSSSSLPHFVPSSTALPVSTSSSSSVSSSPAKKEELVVQELPPPVVNLNNHNEHAKTAIKERSTANSSSTSYSTASSRNLRGGPSMPASSYSRPVSNFSSCSGGDGKKGKKKKRRGHFPKATTDLLKQWLFEHLDHPYPTEEEKAMLAEDTGLSVKQINYWFTNSRRRFLKKGVE